MIQKEKLTEVLSEISRISGRIVTVTDRKEEKAGFLRFAVETAEEPELFVSVEDTKEDSALVGKLAAAELKQLLSLSAEKEDRNAFLRNVLLGKVPAMELEKKAAHFKIRPSLWCCFLVETEGRKEESLLAALRSLTETNRDYVTELDEHRVAVLKDARQWGSIEEADQFARTICDTVSAELLIRIRVGYGSAAEGFSELPQAFLEAKTALTVGGIFFAGKTAVSYRRLGIGRLIAELPEHLCEMYLKEVFRGKDPEIDEETALAVDRFLENSLNISETARQLYVHRNTLVYRLDRFEKGTGLDVRKFEDAMSFKIAQMVRAQLNYLRENRSE